MKGDFSRLTFDQSKNFSRVLMQQGRVQLDADWNEQSSLLLHHLRELGRALIGPHGGVGDAFHLTAGTGGQLLAIGKGTYFVGGIMCTNDGGLTLTPPVSWPVENGKPKPQQGDYLVYLSVTERHVTFVNDDSIRERALGDGVDTATRTKVVCAVSAVAVDGLDRLTGKQRDDAVENALNKLRPGASAPTMRASVVSQTGPHDICSVPPFSQYRGEGNQLYRVEIHRPASAQQNATFKWSRENGSVALPVTRGAEGRRLTVNRFGRDGRFTLQKGDWVEFEDDNMVATGAFYDLARVESVDGGYVTLDTMPVADFGAHPELHPLLRRWDHAALPAGATYFNRGTIAIHDGTQYPLEQGIQVEFQAGGQPYQRGDYWLIPARTLGGRIDWPKDQFLPARRADGGAAPLASIVIDNLGHLSGTPKDLRRLIEPAAKPAT